VTEPVTAFLGLGANVGDRLETITSCLFVLDDVDGIAVEDVSAVYETAPWGVEDQDPFLNAVVRVRTTLSARALLEDCHRTEAAFGRDRDAEQRWGPRPLDIDLLLYGDEVIDEPDLVVPHPRIAERAFVLVPLMEVFPGGTLPPDGRRLTQVLNALAPIEGVDLFVRLDDVPGTEGRIRRPEAPGGPGAFMASEWERPEGPPPDVQR
jgi:2-amino-4-hydroxy-6-hydroxymethyldihydropteridine diphosphokinase